MTTAPKVYDFPMARVEDKLVSFLKRQRGESTIADMISGTALPKYQVEQAAKVVLDEYTGRLKVTESGELLYYFPAGMRSTVNGFGPSLARFWKTFARGAARVLSFLFKVWIVVMLVGYFIAFVALGVLAMVASVAASAAGRGGRDDRSRGGGGFGGMYLAMSLLDLILRMWFWSSILGMNDTRRKPREGRAFYKSVFGFVFGEGDPNEGWEENERKHVISYIQASKGVITLEELMALTGRESDDANALMNRLLLEFEGEPGVTDNGTLIYTFPELMRTSEGGRASGSAATQSYPSKRPVLFSANKPRTNGWIIFFNSFNLLFGTYFLVISMTQGAAALARTGPAFYSFTGNLLLNAGINPLGFLAVGLGFVPVAFSIFFFLIPLFRRIRLARQNEAIRTEALRRQVISRVLSSPSRVDAGDLRPPLGLGPEPKNFAASARRILDRVAAQLKAEPVVEEGTSSFAYRFAEVERELADLEAYRKNVDVRRYDVGKTVFDSGA
ncbi:MAG: hypothetical protein ABSG17_07700 [Spirochaetia bacterium]